jgi:glycosyltransferase involved in cell wall biosynthesis
MTPIVNAYFALCERVLGAPWTDAARNLTIANSQWTAAGLRRLGELSNPIVIYPPVLDPGDGLPWADRDDTFLCIGRFDATKRIDTAMSIVAGVRANVLSRARLVIVGSPVDRGYADRMRSEAAGHGDWIEFRENLSRVELNRLLGRSRFGIQAMVDEHFGMATAEMTRAGCVVFAHDSGGTREVLNADARLLWSTEVDAVQRVGSLVSDAAAVGDVRSRLRAHSEQFSTENFVAQLRALVLLAHGPVRRSLGVGGSVGEDGRSGQPAEFGVGH